ncbi:GTP-binding protein Di-Ras2-like [Hydractinia symbiolongicarpus]|uniref:GTP-binding protein Di-Ras2-like n=1 Tax=Hydractinia symbiolongicarpus TaxID=13093 RepID=UPI002551B18F|nr:GTP-binding protein Di-Ras2-like [Hydractinia symbiolongicarpus]
MLARGLRKSMTDLSTIKKTFRLSVFGAAEVGKSKFIGRFINRDKYTDTYVPTIEDFYETLYDFKGVSLNIEIVDTSGTEQFPAMRRLNINKSDLVFLMYDVTEISTVLEVARLYDIVRTESLCPIVIIGAKADKLPDIYGYQNTTITRFMTAQKDHALFHVLCSAKTGFKIDRPFEIGFQDLIPNIDAIIDLLLVRKDEIKVSHTEVDEKGEKRAGKSAKCKY